MEINDDEIVASIRDSQIDLENLRLSKKPLVPVKEEILDFKFRIGDEVKDQKTGKVGKIIAIEKFRFPK